MAMTRLVVPHAYCTEYAGSIVEDSGRDRTIEPVSGSGKWSGWTPAPTRRNWLDQNDAAAVVRLVQRYLDDRDVLPPRLGRALWLHEYLTQVRWLDVAWPLTVTALEALLNTDKHGQRAQFIGRTKALARELLVPGVDLLESRVVERPGRPRVRRPQRAARGRRARPPVSTSRLWPRMTRSPWNFGGGPVM